MEQEQKGRWFEFRQFPHVYVLLVALCLVTALGTWLLPAGQFERIFDEALNRDVIVPGTFHLVEASPVSFFGAFEAILAGFTNGADVIGFVFFAYAAWFVVLRTGALHAAVGALLRSIKPSAQPYIIPLFIFIFGSAASVFGMFEETYGFLPLFVGMAIAMGYDAIVGTAIVAMGIGMGYSAACMNPFTVLLAQKYAELPLLSGMWFRIAVSAVMLSACAWWTMRYAARIKADPSKSYMQGIDMGTLNMNRDSLTQTAFTKRSVLVCLVCAVAIGLLIWGVTIQGWYFDEIGAIFLLMGIVGGIVGGLGLNGTARAFADGFADIATGCLIIGFSRALLVILQQGQIIDTVTYYISAPLVYLPRWLAAEGMLIVQNLINFFIPSGSGQAVVSMPIMAPLSDLLGIQRQVAVLAFQFGDGLSNIMWPTADILVICAITRVPLNKWYKFFAPFFGLAILMQAIAIAVAVAINLQ